MSIRRGRQLQEDDKLPVLGEDEYGNASGYYNNNHVRNVPVGSRAFSSGSRPGSSSRRTPTPTKQIALQAVRRKDDGVKESFDDVDLAELNSTLKLESERSFLERDNSSTDLKKGDRVSGFKVKLPNGYGARPKESDGTEEIEKKESVPNSISKQKTTDSKPKTTEVSSKTEDSSDEDEDEDEDNPASWQEGSEKTAPMQLMMEFIGCLMQGDYPNAAKLCKMILMYEPDNAEALKFQPLINEKIELDAQPDDDSGSGESGTEDDDEEDEGNSDDSDSDDSDDSDESDDSSQSEAEDDAEKIDSGISSGLSGSNSNSEME
ncbi:glutamate-rich protein 2-like [Ylistrum balloti]|uniref:glutamate-rich protein 2-like n=1 Tax=Ylistrum balloti TaxID=509963 RepID=UPI002905CEF2|nr:glutamate-rich protein 2-like [Ylistrum balloti]